MRLELWGMSALAGVCSGLVDGYLIAWQGWIQFWIDRDRERLYQILVGLAQFQKALPFCAMEPPSGQRIYLDDPVVKIKENARVIDRKKNKGLANKLYKFGAENLGFGDKLQRLTGAQKENLRQEKQKEVEALMKEVEQAIGR